MAQVGAVGYVVCLLLLVLSMRFIGERWWLTTVLLYLPRLLFAIPLPIIIVLAAFRRQRMLIASSLAALLLQVPLLGLSFGALTARLQSRPPQALRLVSYNVEHARDPERLAATIALARPDLLLLQEWHPRARDPVARQLPSFHFHAGGQFAVFSRYAISDVWVAGPAVHPGSRDSSEPYARYRISAPWGPLTVLNVHPVSPRRGFESLRRREGADVLRSSSRLRRHQAQEIANETLKSQSPVLIVGDTNLPGLSGILADTLGRFHDGFFEAGWGLGYTYPAERPWMRLDRVLADDRIRFLRLETLPQGASFHRAVLAEISPR